MGKHRRAAINSFLKYLDEILDHQDVCNNIFKNKTIVRDRCKCIWYKMNNIPVMKQQKIKKLVIFCLVSACNELNISLEVNVLMRISNLNKNDKSSCFTSFINCGYSPPIISQDDVIINKIKTVTGKIFGEDKLIHEYTLTQIINNLTKRSRDVISSSSDIIAASILFNYCNTIDNGYTLDDICEMFCVKTQSVKKKEENLRIYFKRSM